MTVLRIFERLGVPYYLTGSMAGSVYGHARLTADSDVVADMREEHVAPFIAAVEETFYVVPEVVSEAVKQRTSFNLIHNETVFKVDVFVMPYTYFARQEMQRRVRRTLIPGQDVPADMATVEDIILSKLLWYDEGGRRSDLQWHDVLAILGVQSGHLDIEYLKKSAEELDIYPLLARALAEAEM